MAAELEGKDTFRKVYTPLTDQQKAQIQAIKEKAEELELLLDNCIPATERSDQGRCMNVARTNLETTIMWAVKAVTTGTPRPVS